MTEYHKSWIEQCEAAERIEGELAQYLETARETEPFEPSLFDGDEETDPEEIEEMRRDDIRQSSRFAEVIDDEYALRSCATKP